MLECTAYRLLLAGGCVALGLMCAQRSEARESTRHQEMAQCLPGELLTWPDGQDRPAGHEAVKLVYRHAGAPSGFDEALVLGSVQRAAAAWSACGIGAEVLSKESAALTPGVVIVQWSETQARGNFALANLAQRSLSLNPASFELLARRKPRHPAAQTLQMAVSHEMGHFFGLMAHSRRCIDVMSYYDNGRGETCFIRDGVYQRGVEYRSLLPTACDIARCRAVNGTKR